MSASKTTTDHAAIRKWVEERKGYPATVKATEENGEPGLLRIDFDGKDEPLDRIDWDSFFKKFDAEKLAFLYQESTQEGSTSRFCKFVDRDQPAS